MMHVSRGVKVNRALLGYYAACSGNSTGENGGGQGAQKDLHSRTGRDETKGKTQERMERGN